MFLPRLVAYLIGLLVGWVIFFVKFLEITDFRTERSIERLYFESNLDPTFLYFV